MIDYTILCYGLTRKQIHTLKCSFSLGYDICAIPDEAIDDCNTLQKVLSNTWCLFINPKKLKTGVLTEILYAHEYATRHTHAAILLFTDPFTEEQKLSVDTNALCRVDLRTGFDATLRKVVELVRKGCMPCWNGMARMRSNMFNDGWYLLDIETSGTDPLESDVISLSVSYMANYKIQFTETLYIKQEQPISEKVESITGSSNEMLEEGLTKEQAVEYLNNLPTCSPIIFESYRYYVPFLKALYHSCGKRFDLPYVEIDGLAAIAFSYTSFRNPYDVLPAIKQRRIERTQVEHPYLAKLYDLTLAVFENLQDRYGINAAGDFHSLYYASIECGE